MKPDNKTWRVRHTDETGQTWVRIEEAKEALATQKKEIIKKINGQKGYFLNYHDDCTCDDCRDTKTRNDAIDDIIKSLEE